MRGADDPHPERIGGRRIGAEYFRAVQLADAVVCGDDVALGRPAPFLIFRAMEQTGVTSVHQVMCVGDTVLDLQAGHNAGVRYVVGVLSGAHGKEQLETAPHTHLVASVAALSSVQF